MAVRHARLIELPATGLEAVPDRWWAGGGLRKDSVDTPRRHDETGERLDPHISVVLHEPDRASLPTINGPSRCLIAAAPPVSEGRARALARRAASANEHVSPSSPQVPGLLERIGRDLDKAESKTVSLIRMNTGWHQPENRTSSASGVR